MAISYHQRILKLLSDGQWHSLREITTVVARFIDRAAAEKEFARRHPNHKEIKPSERIAQGKKRLIFLSLNSAIHHRKIVVAKGHDWDRQYRLTKKALQSRQPSKTEPTENQA